MTGSLIGNRKAYKFLGCTGVISGPMIASGRTFTDIEAEIAERNLKRIIHAEEWADFHSSNAANALSYDGYDIQLVTNAVDNLGNTLTSTGTTIPALDKVIKLIRLQGGETLHGIFCSFGQQQVINQLVSQAARYFVSLDQEAVLRGGAHVVQYMSPLGSVPVFGDFFVNPALPYPWNTVGSSGATGSSLSNIYFLRFDEAGGSVMVDLVPLGRTELAKLADTVRFYMNVYTILAVKGEPWEGLLKNVGEPS